MKIIDTQKGRYARIDTVDFAGFDDFEQLANFHRGFSIVLQDFLENALKDGGYPDSTASDLFFAMQGHRNTTDYIFSLLAGHIHDLEDQLGFLHDPEIDVITDNQEGGEE